MCKRENVMGDLGARELVAIMLLGCVACSLIHFALTMRGAGKRAIKEIGDVIADGRMMSWVIVACLDGTRVQEALEAACRRLEKNIRGEWWTLGLCVVAVGCGALAIRLRRPFMADDSWLIVAKACQWILLATVALGTILCFVRSVRDFRLQQSLRVIANGPGAERLKDLEDGRISLGTLIRAQANGMMFNGVIRLLMGIALIAVIAMYVSATI